MFVSPFQIPQNIVNMLLYVIYSNDDNHFKEFLIIIWNMQILNDLKIFTNLFKTYWLTTMAIYSYEYNERNNTIEQ